MDVEGKVGVIKVGDDEDVPLRVGGGGKAQVAGQVDDRDDHVPGLEDALDVLLGLLHRFYGADHHNLQHLGYVDAEGFPRDGEL